MYTKNLLSRVAKCILAAFLLVQFFVNPTTAEIADWDDANFQSQLQLHQHAFVKFYSPNCPHCKRMAPTWEDLSDQISHVVPIVDVDCTSSGSSTCTDYSVRGYPTLKYIKYAGDGSAKSNSVVDYEKGRDLKSLKSFAEFHALPALTRVAEEALTGLLETKDQVVLVAVFPESSKLDKTDGFFAAVEKLADQFKGIVKMVYTTQVDLVKQKYSALASSQLPAVLLIRPTVFEYTEEAAFEIESDVKKLAEFIRSKVFGLVPIVDTLTEQVMAYPRITVLFNKDFSDDSAAYAAYYKVLAPLAKSHKQYQFALGSIMEFSEKSYRLGLDPRSTKVFLLAETDGESRYVPATSSSLAADKIASHVEQFIADLSAKKLEKFIKSEPVPSEQEYAEQAVKTVVGRSFDSIVLDETKDVLLEIYAPWCGHCKNLAPIYEKLATTLKGADNLVIAKIDGTANDIPAEFSFRGFPTIYFAKIGKKSSPMQYSGARDHKSFLEWLQRRVTHPIDEHIKDEL